ncbi:MAG: hypothetical protein ACRDXX_22020, partial [Stackebrandtia sp.]
SAADALDVEAALSRAARALIVLEGGPGGRTPDDVAELPGATAFRNAVDEGYARLAMLLRNGAAPPPPDFEAAVQQLDAALAAGDEASRPRRRLLDWESDVLVEALSDANLLVDGWSAES